MARRRKRNPSATQWALIGVASVGAGVGVYYGARALRRRRARKKLAGLPRPERIGGELPDASTAQPQPCGSSYPGFVRSADGACEPGRKTPPGIYIAEGCTDFVFVEGENGPQPKFVESIITEEAMATSDGGAVSADPTSLVTDFFSEFWGECSWPPTPDGPPRLVHLYQALVYVFGQEIVKAGGRVLGTDDIDAVDEQVADRLSELGYPDYDPDIVPELDPSWEEPVQATVAFQ